MANSEHDPEELRVLDPQEDASPPLNQRDTLSAEETHISPPYFGKNDAQEEDKARHEENISQSVPDEIFSAHKEEDLPPNHDKKDIQDIPLRSSDKDTKSEDISPSEQDISLVIQKLDISGNEKEYTEDDARINPGTQKEQDAPPTPESNLDKQKDEEGLTTQKVDVSSPNPHGKDTEKEIDSSPKDTKEETVAPASNTNEKNISTSKADDNPSPKAEPKVTVTAEPIHPPAPSTSIALSLIERVLPVAKSLIPRPMLPDWKMLAMYIFCAGMLVGHFFAIARWPTGEYGMGVLQESMNCTSNGSAYMVFLIAFPLNLLSSILCLPSTLFKSEGRRRRPHFIIRWVMVLATIPLHLLYNSLFFRSTSAYDGYEILVGDDFLHKNSTPIDLSTLPLLQTGGKWPSPIKHDYNKTTPNLSNVTSLVLHLQEALTSNYTQTAWKNMTFSSCRSRYSAGTFEHYSHVLVISNYTTPPDTDNAALALTILSGHAGPKHQSHQSLVSLVPPDFFIAHNRTVPKKWKFVKRSKPKGLFDPYAPKKFPLKQQNVFVKSCYSYRMPHRCRLLYSPLVLKVATWCLVVTVGGMTLGLLFSEDYTEDNNEDDYKGLAHTATAVVFVAYVVMLIVLGATEAAKRKPSGPSDQGWILNAFSVINVVQLIDTILDTFIGVYVNSPSITIVYFPISLLWHWFTSGVFSMVIFDRYIISNSTLPPFPGTDLVPSADLSSLWFKSMFNWFKKASYGSGQIGLGAFAACALVFGIPFLLRVAVVKAIADG
jgi:hypothetical protein